jgi:adenine-specific DNA-methyltransferase
MEKMNLSTPDITQENIEKIAELFPDTVTEAEDPEGNIVRFIDFDALKADLSGNVVDDAHERYQFTWPGKRAAKAEARESFDGTLRPCREKSVDWDTTENVYIEGDNLQALKLMRETYAGKVKLIYIDPPYNTGHDFIYDDDFAKTRADYDAESGDYDEEGGRLVANPESNGRFHSDWCSMMYPRLLLARDLLSDDGAIFISIDDNESMNLRKICDEVFGAENFITEICWEKRFTRSNNAKLFASLVDYILVYRKSPALTILRESRSAKNDSIYKNPDNDPRGPWTSVSYVNPATREQRPNLCYEIKNPITGKQISHPTNAWKYSYETYLSHVQDNKLYWGHNGENKYPRLKKFLSEMDGGIVPANLWKREEAGTTDAASKDLEKMLGRTIFDFPKPVSLLSKCIDICAEQGSIIVDFFSGSATTAHAVMKRNAEDGGHRKFFLVQLPELCNEKSEAYKAGYRTICDIGEERIRRAGATIKAEVEEANKQLKIGEDPKPVPDIGFRVFRVDSSNFRDTYREPGEVEQSQLDLYVDNLKEDRTAEDLLFQVLPKFRIPYSAKIEEREVCGKRVFDVEDGQLVACFDEEVGADAIESIAKERPLYAVFRDSSLADDATEANFEELFKTYSPDTIRRVI